MSTRKHHNLTHQVWSGLS